jgi:hypothetical protein
MTQQQHPITPPPELVQQWRAAASNVPATPSTDPGGRRDYIDFIATRAAQWGADQELEACLAEVSSLNSQALADRVRAARRPKPPSLKEQALSALENLNGECLWETSDLAAIRRALEQLPDPS